ncbi:SRPBCC domain-containing protein [Candidatus Bathyarchaeota archaeon]|nr:SRPBCC domain-containing protein [Candidatus Bathyarchaeota archaeon]
MKTDEAPIIVKESFNKDLDTVWNAITETEQMRKWFFKDIPEFKPIVGFEVEFDVKTGDKIFTHQWKITRVIPRKVIEYNWKYGDYSGDSFVTFELKEEYNSTILKLTHLITEDFPADIPEFKRESCLSGWSYFIKERLKEYLKSI